MVVVYAICICSLKEGTFPHAKMVKKGTPTAEISPLFTGPHHFFLSLCLFVHFTNHDIP
jgi:hypothetical protein